MTSRYWGGYPPSTFSEPALTLVLLNGFSILDTQNEALGVFSRFHECNTDYFPGKSVFDRLETRVIFQSWAFPFQIKCSLASSLSPIPLKKALRFG